MLFVPGQNILS